MTVGDNVAVKQINHSQNIISVDIDCIIEKSCAHPIKHSVLHALSSNFETQIGECFTHQSHLFL